jgi:uncharacterized membrane protein YkoI
MFRSLSQTVLIACLAAALSPVPADAALRGVPAEPLAVPPFADARPMADRGISLDEAVNKVRRRYGDVTILKARTKKRNGGRVHRIKFLTDSGRVRTVQVDAETGEFL